MAIGVIFTAPGITHAQYEHVRDAALPGNRPAPGMLYHAAGPFPAGWRAVEIWESRADFDRYVQEKLGVALRQAGSSIEPGGFTVETFDVVNTVQP